MKKKALVMMVVLPGMAFALETDSVRFDARSSGLIAAGVESKGTPSGASVTSWDTTSVADGWQTLSSESQSKQVLVLNGPSVEGGRLAANATWNAGVHVVRHDVIVPSGKTLTLAYGCKVKFAEGTRIWVEQGGTIKANGANVTELADDSVGGDTNHDGASSAGGSRWWWQAPSAAAVADYLRPTASCVSWAQVGLGELTLNGGGASAEAGALAPRVYSTNDTSVCVGTLPTLTRSGYVFGGWWTQPDGSGTQVTSTTKVKGLVTTIYAYWSADAGHSFPDLGSSPTAAQVATALADVTDAGVRKHITDGVSYNAFRSWALAVRDSSGNAAGVDAVAKSSRAWLSYALACETLISVDLKGSDVKVEKFEATSTAGSFAFTVGIGTIPVGNDAKAENLATVFGLEGGSSLDALSSDSVTLTFGTPSDGKVKFTAGPKNASQKAFFMRVKMTP